MWIKQLPGVELPLMPVGGYKAVGVRPRGRPEVMQHCTQTKSVWVDLQEEPADWFGGRVMSGGRCATLGIIGAGGMGGRMGRRVVAAGDPIDRL